MRLPWSERIPIHAPYVLEHTMSNESRFDRDCNPDSDDGQLSSHLSEDEVEENRAEDEERATPSPSSSSSDSDSSTSDSSSSGS